MRVGWGCPEARLVGQVPVLPRRGGRFRRFRSESSVIIWAFGVAGVAVCASCTDAGVGELYTMTALEFG